MITKWSGITYRYKDLYGHLHCFKDKQKAKESYRKFLHENELYNGCWLGDKGKYEPLYCYMYGSKTSRVDV